MRESTVFSLWERKRIRKRRPFVEPSRKDRNALAGIDTRLRQKTLDKLAILRKYNRRLSDPKFKTKERAIGTLVRDYNSAILQPDGPANSVRHISRSSIYSWKQKYADGGLLALVPQYKIKESSAGKVIFRPLPDPIELKFAGRPRRNGKAAFVARLKRHFKNPPLECPARVSVFYSFPIPKKTPMARRMRLLKGRISHTRKPDLRALNAFIVDCMTGIVFKDHSQIVQFHSAKQFDWFPQTRILIKPLPG